MKNAKEHNTPLSANELAEIRRHLPHGSMTSLAAKYGTTVQYVSRVLNGWKYDYKIVSDALDIALKEKAAREEKEKKLQGKVKKLSA